MKKLLCLLVLSLFTLKVYSQTPISPILHSPETQASEDTLEWCGDIFYEPIAVRQVAYSRTNVEKRIKVVFNIIWADTIVNLTPPYNTTTYIDPEYVVTAFNDLVNAFEGSNISFELADIIYLNLAEYPAQPYTPEGDTWDQIDFGDALMNSSYCFNRMSAPLLRRIANWNGTNIQYHPNDYLNVYVYPRECNQGILGWSYIPPYIGDPMIYYPWTPESNITWGDGVWVKSSAFGDEDREGISPTAHNNGTLIHEVGHYLGLYHVFQGIIGCGETLNVPFGSPYSVCETTGDLVCDTAPTKQVFSCTPLCPDYIWPNDSPWNGYQSINYMGYYPDVCKLQFTAGQIERMHAYVAEYRPDVFEYACEGELIADFNGDNIVGTADLVALLSCVGPYEGCDLYDLNNDGFITITDIMIFLTYYGMSCDPFSVEAPLQNQEHMMKRLNLYLKN